MHNFCYRSSVIFAVLFFTISATAQVPGEIRTLRNITPAGSGYLFTDKSASSIYYLSEGSLSTLHSSPGCGGYFTLSTDEKMIGFKYINGIRQQIPSLLNISNGTITPLYDPVERCGQVSFSANGSIAFTIDTELVVLQNGKPQVYDLGTYANLAPISPDGRFAAYNDGDDMLWIIDLRNGLKERITEAGKTFFYPQWSPDSEKLLYSGLNGTVYVYIPSERKTYYFGKGYEPVWSDDSEYILFYRKEIEKHSLINSDIFIADYRAGQIRRLTSTQDENELSPAFDSDGSVLYVKQHEAVLTKAERNIKDGSLQSESVLYDFTRNTELFNNSTFFDPLPQQTEQMLDIPYIHQVYDTPTWYNGHWACGPTTSSMLLAYYRILPIWETFCFEPTSHYSYWGRYICDVYQFRETTYNLSAGDPNGTPSNGIYGYMWSSGSPHSRMAGFYQKNWISAETGDYPSHSFVVSEIESQNPYSLCNGLTTAGHIVLAHGLGTENHTIITNDPYGDKNTPYYPSYDGKNAAYDWPGYNNGYQNFNTVYWGVTSRYTRPEFSDTLIDDLHFAEGFQLRTKSPASMIDYRDRNLGYNDHFWWTPTRYSPDGTDTAYAVWKPVLPQKGRYEIFVYIPFSEAEDAQYEVHHLNGITTVHLNQKAYTDSWASLGMFSFAAGDSGYLQLGDGSSIGSKPLIIDAAYWTYIDTVTVSVPDMSNSDMPGNYSLAQNYPNPFNPSTTIDFSIAKAGYVSLKIYDILGNEIKTIVNGFTSAGNHSAEWDGTNSSGTTVGAGLYFYRLQAGTFSESRKMILLK